MTTVRKSLPAVRLAVWQGRPDCRFWGDDAMQHTLDTCLMTRLFLRADDRNHDDASAIGDCVLKVWMDVDGSMTVEAMLHDAYLMGWDEVAHRLRVLKTLNRKLEKAGFHRYRFHRDMTPYGFLTAICTAVGIRHTCTYLPNRPGAEPESHGVTDALGQIAETLTRRLDALRLRRSA